MLLAGASGVGKTAFARALLDGFDGMATIDVQWLMAAAAGPAIPFGAFAPLVPEVGGELTARPGRPLICCRRLRRAVIARAGDKDLMLVVDDAHRLDEASATLVFQLVSAGKRRGRRDGREPGPRCRTAYAPCGRKASSSGSTSQPLGRDHTVLLASQLLGGQLDGDLSEALWQTSRGNPLYLRELVAGRPRPPERWSPNAACGGCAARLTVGPRLTELVQERLARVSRSEMATLEMSPSAIPVPLSVLTRLAPSSYISSLQRQGLVAVESIQRRRARASGSSGLRRGDPGRRCRPRAPRTCAPSWRPPSRPPDGWGPTCCGW